MTRFGIMLTGYCAIAAVVLPAFLRPAPRLVWNASASVPIGLYSTRPAASARLGDLVAAYAPAPVARLMAERHYLPLRVPMLKHVAAVAGQTVCRSGLTILIDGKRIAEARPRDRIGRPLPSWSGCRLLRTCEVFLLNPASNASFDGRYFGPVPARGIVAVLDPLWLPGGGAAASASASDGREISPEPSTHGGFHDQHR
ncbi:S26 family signal peptidase [Sphingomonas suaedae]|uniref:S26 family signal peptidase n=1 Tax=Sphingomonas suaedae TaxID=2599297 RepID=A0A518RHX5_9SPHN|nr:S26 family signal peptidase [Sphingomonas suaedae]QDX27009.1 S26 family signal peptidase [Sphingomonas suaedae]